MVEGQPLIRSAPCALTAPARSAPLSRPTAPPRREGREAGARSGGGNEIDPRLGPARRFAGKRLGLDHARRRARLGRGGDRRPDHQDQQQPVLRQDEGRRRGQGQGARRRAAELRRQVRRRQREPGRRGREPDLGRRQGHPDHAQRHQGDRADHQEGARRRHPGDRARHAARSDRRRRRHLRHRQFQGRRADRRVGAEDPGRQGEGRARSPSSTRSRTSRPSTCCATRAS